MSDNETQHPVDRARDGAVRARISIDRERHLYAVAAHEEERGLMEMEMRALFGCEPLEGCILTERNIDPGRSPFIREKLTVIAAAPELAGLAEQAETLDTGGRTFKAVFVETDGGVGYEEQRAVERAVGARIHGRAEMRSPEVRFGIARTGGVWLLGRYERSEAVWLKHNAKPRAYSTALGTRMARAVVNIAVPEPEGRKAVDPCCGIGTVVIEALSMGLDMRGFDLNPLAVRGARANLAHFGMPDVVQLADMRELDGRYDAAVLDLPYNLCSVMPAEVRLDMLRSVRRLASRIVVVTTEPIGEALAQAGLKAVDRCTVGKGSRSRFARQVILCR